MDREQLIRLERNISDLDIAMNAVDYVRIDLDIAFDKVLKSQLEELRKIHRQLIDIQGAIYDLLTNNGGAE